MSCEGGGGGEGAEGLPKDPQQRMVLYTDFTSDLNLETIRPGVSPSGLCRWPVIKTCFVSVNQSQEAPPLNPPLFPPEGSPAPLLRDGDSEIDVAPSALGEAIQDCLVRKPWLRQGRLSHLTKHDSFLGLVAFAPPPVDCP